MNNILLIYPTPDDIKDYRFGYSLLLLYIAADLLKDGYNVNIIDFSVKKYDYEYFSSIAQKYNYVIMEIDAFPLKRSANILNARKIAYDIRKIDNNIKIFAVGKQCTLFHQCIDFVDVTVCGDSEISLSSIIKLNNKKFYDVGNITDLSLLPRPAYNILSLNQICGETFSKNMHLAPSALMETSRGCPGKCSFCQRKGWLSDIYAFPIESISDNFLYLANNGIKNIWFTDENFSGILSKSKEVLKKIIDIKEENNIKISISSWVHIDTEFLDLAKKAGVSIISFGIESINKKNQQYFNKIYDIEKVYNIISYANSIGIFTVGNFIIGTPYDSVETIDCDFEYAIKCKFDSINLKTLDYMIGSDLYDMLSSDMKKDIHFFSCKERNTTNFSSSELKKIASNFRKKFIMHNANRIAKKILKYGQPYYGDENE